MTPTRFRWFIIFLLFAIMVVNYSPSPFPASWRPPSPTGC